MCDDHAEVWNTKWQKARKSHTCYECNRAIKPREIYLFVRMLFDGVWDNHHVCMVCRAHWDIFSDDGCILIGGLREHESEMQHEIDNFVLLDSNTAECMKEQFIEDSHANA